MTKPDKRIFLVCETYPPRSWGQELAAQRMARALVRLGFRVEVLTTDFQPQASGHPTDSAAWRTVVESDGVTVTRLRPTDGETQRWTLELALQARGPADVVLAFAMGSYAPVAVAAAVRWGVPSVLFGRGRDAMYDLFDWRQAPSLIEALRRTDRVVAVTKEMARLLQPFHPAGDVVSWPNVVDQSHFHRRGGQAGLRRRYGLPETGLLAGFSGHLRPSKGIEEMLGALVRLRRHRPDAGLVIIGGITERAEPTVAAWRQRHPQHVPSLHVLPFIEPAQLPEVLSCLDQAWFPVIFDGFSNSLLETVACGVPVIATPIGGNPEVIRDGETGLLVPVGDVEALAAASLRLVRDPVAAAAMAARALEELPSRYHPSFEQERLQRLMQDCGLLT